jgi:hypothetical protein
MSLELFFLKKTNKFIYNTVEEYYHSYTNAFMINEKITNFYINHINIAYIKNASNTNILEWFKGIGFEFKDIRFKFIKQSIINAVCTNNIQVLEWFVNEIIESFDEYAYEIISFAAKGGNIEVLEWFINYREI